MSQVLFHSPGQQVSVVLQILNSSGTRADGYTIPSITRIILPTLSLSPNYPFAMVKIDTGLYYHKFTLPSGSTAAGTYIVDIKWIDADMTTTKNDYVQVVVSAPYGQFSVTPG